MLQITVPSGEYWDEIKEEFVSTKGQTLQLEHSLVSISKWEFRWHKAFYRKTQKNAEVYTSAFFIFDKSLQKPRYFAEI